MTISSDSIKNSYAGNGSTKDFAITFTYFDNSEIQVYLKTDSSGVEVLKALTTHYTISGSPGSSPLVSMGTAPASGETLLVKRNTPFTQLTDYTAGDAFPADSHEAALDKLAALCQQLKETLSRSWTFPHSYSTLSDVKLPIPENNAVVRWNADASALMSDTSLANATYQVSPSDDDGSAGYLEEKLKPGTGLSATTANPGGDEEYTFSVNAAQTQITSVGALNAGSITSGFGTIDTGSSNITTTGTVSAGLISGAAVKDEDNMASDSATHLASQQSIKAYVDAVTSSLDAQDLDVTSDSGTIDVDISSETLTIAGGTGATSSAAGTTVTIAVDAAQTQITSVGALDGGSITSGFGTINTGSSSITTSGAVTGGTLAGTVSTATQNSITTATGLTSTGALDAGSITSNFGTINTGSSGITTTGLISGGSLDIDDVLINGSTIGHTDDTDLITVADGLVTVAGEISVTTLDIGGTNVTSTAAELNLLDGVSGLVQADLTKLAAIDASAAEINLLDGVSGLVQADLTKLAAVDSTAAELNLLDGSAKSTASITIADTDAFIVIDGTTTKQIPASDISTYAGGSVAGTPAGAIIASGSASVPSGYFYCDGSAVSRTTYSDLFTAIVEYYGEGDNSSTFNIPDFRGYFLRGQDDGSSHDTDDSGRTALATGGNTGDNIGSFQDDGTAVNNLSASTNSTGAHTHSLPVSVPAGGSIPTGTNSASYSFSGATGSSGSHSHTVSLSSSDNETRPKNVYVRYYIKY